MTDSVRVTTHHADGTTQTRRIPGRAAASSDDPRAAIEAFAAVPRPFWSPDDERFAWLRNRKLHAGVLLVLAVGFGIVWVLRTPSGSESVAPAAASRPDRSATPGGTASGASSTTVVSQLTVHVAGAVVRPGVVRLRPGARVIDALDATGGAQPEADLTRLNLAAPLADGAQVLVTRIGEPAPASSPTGGRAGSSSDGVVNINTASAEELDALPGIGPTRAAAIIAEREARGPFANVDDLHRVRGLGASRIDGLRSRVRT